MYRFGFVFSCFSWQIAPGDILLMSEQQPGSGGFHPRIPLIPRIGAHLGRPATGRERGRSGCGTDGVKTRHTNDGLVFTPSVRTHRGSAARRTSVVETGATGSSVESSLRNRRNPRNPQMIHAPQFRRVGS